MEPHGPFEQQGVAATAVGRKSIEIQGKLLRTAQGKMHPTSALAESLAGAAGLPLSAGGRASRRIGS